MPDLIIGKVNVPGLTTWIKSIETDINSGLYFLKIIKFIRIDFVSCVKVILCIK